MFIILDNKQTYLLLWKKTFLNFPWLFSIQISSKHCPVQNSSVHLLAQCAKIWEILGDFFSQYIKAQRIIWLYTNIKKNWTFLYSTSPLSILHSFLFLSLLVDILMIFFFLERISANSPSDGNWTSEMPINIAMLRLVNSLFVSLAKFVHLNFKDFVSWSTAQGENDKTS